MASGTGARGDTLVSAHSALFATIHEFLHRHLGIPDHASPDALQKAVIAKLSAGDGLIVRILRRLRQTGEKCLDQRVYESKQSLLSEANTTDLPRYPVQACGNSVLGFMDFLFSPGKFAFDRATDECARTGETAIFDRALDSLVERLIGVTEAGKPMFTKRQNRKR